MTPAREALLALIAAQGTLTLSGNREHYAVLRFQDGVWLLTEGDSLTGAESSYTLDPALALSRIRARLRNEMGHYGPDRGEVSDEALRAFARDWYRTIQGFPPPA